MTLWSLICADPVDIDLPVHSCKTLWLFNDGSKVFQESLWPSHPKRKSEQNFEQAELLQELSPGAQQPFINSCIFMNAGSFVWWLRILVSQDRRSSYRRLSSTMLTLQRNNSSNCPRVFGEDSRAFCWIPLSEWCVASSNINLHTGTAQWLEQKQFTQQNHH